MEKRVTILGAGLAGLSAGHALAEGGVPVLILEKEPYIGGLAASFKSGDFVYDLGPHRFHSQNTEILEHIQALLGDNLHYRERLSRIFMNDQFFNYPLKTANVLRNLPATFLLKAFIDYLGIRLYNMVRPIPDDCFENWVKKRFGNTLYKMFFGTYTEKAWGMPCTQISADWAAQRITLLNLWDTVKKTLFKPKNVPRTYVSQFLYPREGGIGAISQRYGDYIRERGGEILTRAEIREIQVKGNRAESITFMHQGREQTCPVEYLISTIPCTVLPTYLAPAPPGGVMEANRALKHIAVVMIIFDVAREKVTDDHWIYLPEHDLTVHRISEFKNFSETCCPPDRTMVCAEIMAHVGNRIWTAEPATLKKIAVQDLAKVGLIEPEEAGRARIHRRAYSYPVYDLTYKENLDTLLAYLDAFENLKTAGRQGLFKYNNMDHSIEMGLEVGRAVLTGEEGDHRVIASEEKYFG
jgi:protoporphyrinogen oxidase